MIKIWGLYVKGLQNDRPSNFENDLTPVQLESRPTGSRGAGAGWQTFSCDLQLWQLVTLKPFDQQTSNFQYWDNGTVMARWDWKIPTDSWEVWQYLPMSRGEAEGQGGYWKTSKDEVGIFQSHRAMTVPLPL